MMRKVAVSKIDAIAIARNAVARANADPQSYPLAVLDEEPLELWWAWVVPVQSAEFFTRGDPHDMAFGPLLVGLSRSKLDHDTPLAQGRRRASGATELRAQLLQ